MDLQPEKAPGLLDVLARVPDLRKRRGRRYLLVFVLAVAVACVLAGAGELPGRSATRPLTCRKEVLARLGGKPHPLLRRIIAPSRTRIRTLVHAIGADVLDDLDRAAGCAPFGGRRASWITC